MEARRGTHMGGIKILRAEAGPKGILVQLATDDLEAARTQRHTLLLIDCSPAMAGMLEDAKMACRGFVAELGTSDMASVIAYGAEQARLIIGPAICTSEGRRQIEQAIDENVDPMEGRTFGRALELAFDTVRNLAQMANVEQACILFTNGAADPDEHEDDHVVGDHERAEMAARSIGSAEATLSVVGLGTYYDPPFVARLVAAAGHGGVVRHINEIDELGGALRAIRDSLLRTSRKALEAGDFGLDFGLVTRILRTTPEIAATEGSRLRGHALYDGKATLLLETDVPNATFLTLRRATDRDAGRTVAITPASAEALARSTQILAADAAMRGDFAAAATLLRESGDDGLAERAESAVSQRERRETADVLRHGQTTGKRFFGKGLAPRGQNRSILNVLRAVLFDDSAVLFLPDGAYNRGGQRLADPRIIDRPERVLEVFDVVSHRTRFNFSFVARKPVKVTPPNGKTGRPVDRAVIRTINLLRDGELVLPVFSASLSQENHQELYAAGVIKDGMWGANKTFEFDLRGLVTISRAWSDPHTLGLAKLLCDEADLAAKVRSLAARQRRLVKEGKTEPVESTGQTEYLPIYKEATPRRAVGRVETYEADTVEYRVLDRPAAVFDASALDWSTTKALLAETKRALRNTRFLSRAVIFSIEKTRPNAIAWEDERTGRRGAKRSDATLDGIRLRRIAKRETFKRS